MLTIEIGKEDGDVQIRDGEKILGYVQTLVLTASGRRLAFLPHPEDVEGHGPGAVEALRATQESLVAHNLALYYLDSNMSLDMKTGLVTCKEDE